MNLSRSAAAAIAAAMIFCAFLPASAALSKTDATYLRTAMSVQLGRYALGSLGRTKATSASLKSLASHAATQASADTRVLNRIAAAQGVSRPKKPLLSQSFHYSRLSGVSGKTFDARFVESMLIDDREALDADRYELKHGNDTRLKAFAKHRSARLRTELKRLGAK